MTNLGNNYETSKVIVDFYHEKNNSEFVCSCYTPGAPADIEPECLVKTVSYNDLTNHIADSNGKGMVCFGQDQVEEISFEAYLTGLSGRHVEKYLTEVINKLEGRTHAFNQQTETAYL